LDLHVCLRGLQFGAHAEPNAQRSSGVVSPGRSVSERSCKASLGRSVARKITPQMLENSRITQTNQEIAGSARFFSSLLEFARAVNGLLDEDAEVTLWKEVFFDLGNTFIDSLIKALSRFDFAALILTADDLLTSRDVTTPGPRDNVLF